MKTNCHGSSPRGIFAFLFACIAALSFVPLSLGQSQEEDKDEIERNATEEAELYQLSPFAVDASPSGFRSGNTLAGTRVTSHLAAPAGTIGATLGGAQDIAYFRHQVNKGQIPPPHALTAEGLLSEHDLPLKGEGQSGFLIDVACEAIEVDYPAQPNARILVQVGFTTGIEIQDWKPAPLNLVAVVDKSGSMNGQPLALVRQSLLQVVNQLGTDDQLSIVLYGSDTHLHLDALPMRHENKDAARRAISLIESSGSTYLEAGLRLGFQQAKRTAQAFRGNTRVMLFTDEQPNVGRTDADSFMNMAEEASRLGIGLTTIGVGSHFGVELAQKVSNTRGGNLFFFPDSKAMAEKFLTSFDTMVTELAHEMILTIAPASGYEIIGLYGLPGEAVRWRGKDQLRLEVATVFASREKGGIFFALQPKNEEPMLADRPVASITLEYIQADNGLLRESVQQARVMERSRASVGIVRGSYLVDEYITLKTASFQSSAFCHQHADDLLADLQQRFASGQDLDLQGEIDLIDKFRDNLSSFLADSNSASSQQPELKGAQARLPGAWVLSSREDGEPNEILFLSREGFAQIFASSPENPIRFIKQSRYQVNGNRLELPDWGESFDFEVNRRRLILRQGNDRHELDRSRLPGLESPGAIDDDRWQRLLTGLPPRPAKTASIAP